VMCKSEQEAKGADVLAREVVEGKLGLKIYPFDPTVKGSKCSRICTFNNVEFLGLCFQGDKILPGAKAMKKVIQNIKNIPTEYRSSTLSHALYAIRSKVLTWGATYYYTDIPKEFERSVNDHLAQSTRQLLKTCGLIPNAKKFEVAQLSRLGIPSFSDALRHTRKQKSPLN
jgi:hypothetical protein